MLLLSEVLMSVMLHKCADAEASLRYFHLKTFESFMKWGKIEGKRKKLGFNRSRLVSR